MDTNEIVKRSHFSQIANALHHFQKRELVIWGTHEVGIEGKEILESLGFRCSAFISSQPKINNLCGIPVTTPDKLDVAKHYVIVATFATEVNLYLVSHGFEEEDGKDYIRLNAWHDDMECDGCFIGRGTYGFETLIHPKSAMNIYVKKIGRFCSINDTAKIWENHSINFVSTHPFLDKFVMTPPSKKIRAVVENVVREVQLVEIGNDVWIGANVVILPGIKIGDGAIVGAGAIVTKNVEPYAVVGGVPAKTIKYRYPQKMIDSFLRIKWWDWPISKIEKNIHLFYCPNDFCKTFDRNLSYNQWENGYDEK